MLLHREGGESPDWRGRICSRLKLIVCSQPPPPWFELGHLTWHWPLQVLNPILIIACQPGSYLTSFVPFNKILSQQRLLLELKASRSITFSWIELKCPHLLILPVVILHVQCTVVCIPTMKLYVKDPPPFLTNKWKIVNLNVSTPFPLFLTTPLNSQTQDKCPIYYSFSSLLAMRLQFATF